MAHMTLPAAHTEADAKLAERIGRTLDLEEVHVFWTLPAPKAAEAPSHPRARYTGLLGLLSSLVGRISA